MEKLKRYYYTKRGFEYDQAKRMFYKSLSACHDTTYTQKLLGEKPFNEMSNKEKREARFAYFCDNCDKQCSTKWEFKHL